MSAPRKRKAKRAEHTPRTTRTFEDVCGLVRDSLSTRHHWIMDEGPTVIIVAQVSGAMSTAEVQIPKAAFSRMVDWYHSPGGRLPRKARP